MTIKNKRVFVSGGNGIIGRELVKILVEAGAKVYVGDLKHNTEKLPSNIIYRQGDLNYMTKEELQNFAPEIFFHLAATFERSTETYEFWAENFWHNIRLSNHLMTIAKDLDSLKKVIFASSYLVHDPALYQFSCPQANPKTLKENDPIYPRNLTGMAKLSHEIELRFLGEFKSEQYNSIIARIYRGYGKGSMDIISRWIKSLLRGETIEVFRKEGMFDYIYSEDIAEGLYRLSLNKNTHGIYNLGTGKSKKIEDVLNVLEKHFPKMKYEEIDGDIPYEASQADMTKLEAELNWTPKYDIGDAIPKIINYEKKKGKNGARSIADYKNCLITSVSKKIPLIEEVRKSTKKINNKIKIIGNDIDQLCIGKYFVDEFWLSEKITNIKFSDLLKEIEAREIGFIIPTRNGELKYWSKLKNKLEEYNVFTMISDEEQINICLNKINFYQYCVQNKIPAIQSTVKIDDISFKYFVVKEKYGAGSKNIGIRLTKEEAIKKSKELEDPIFQPFIEGIEYSFDGYVDKKGNVKGVILRKRDYVVDGESQITTVFHDPSLNKKIKNYIEKFNFYGHIVGQFIVDQNDKLHLIEINPRFGGASTLGIHAGLDSFFWFFLESMKKNIDNYPFMLTKKEIKQVRHPADSHIIL